MKTKADYLYFAKSKGLSVADRTSLMESINECGDFGKEADDYLNSQRVVASVVFELMKVLKSIGIPVKIFRETDRYRFMLYLSIQQTWHQGLGNILTNTRFTNISTPMVKVPILHPDPYFEAYKSYSEGMSPEDISLFLVKNEEQPIKWVSYTKHGNEIMICSYIKKRNKFTTYKIFIINTENNHIRRYHNLDMKDPLIENGIQWDKFEFFIKEKRKKEPVVGIFPAPAPAIIPASANTESDNQYSEDNDSSFDQFGTEITPGKSHSNEYDLWVESDDENQFAIDQEAHYEF